MKSTHIHVRATPETKRLLSEVAQHNRRNESDMVSVLIEDAHKLINQKAGQPQTGEGAGEMK